MMGSQAVGFRQLLITGLSSKGWYSEHSAVCREAELPGRSVKMKKSER